MRMIWTGACSLIALLSFCVGAHAQECVWKLARIDNDSITLVGADDTKRTAKIGREARPKVAAFLGKSVKVDFEDLKGEQWVVRLESWK